MRRELPPPLTATADGAPGLIKAVEAIWPEAERIRMAGAGKAAHISTHLRQHHLGRPSAHAGDGIQTAYRFFKRADPLRDLPVQPLDALIQEPCRAPSSETTTPRAAP